MLLLAGTVRRLKHRRKLVQFFDQLQEWSDEDEGERAVAASEKDIGSRGNESLVGFLPVHGTRSTLNKSLEYIVQESESRKWLDSNVQNSWWTELGWRRCDTDSQFSAARVCEVWYRF